MIKRAYPKGGTVVVSSRISKDLNEWAKRKAKRFSLTKNEFIAWSIGYAKMGFEAMDKMDEIRKIKYEFSYPKNKTKHKYEYEPWDENDCMDAYRDNKQEIIKSNQELYYDSSYLLSNFRKEWFRDKAYNRFCQDYEHDRYLAKKTLADDNYVETMRPTDWRISYYMKSASHYYDLGFAHFRDEATAKRAFEALRLSPDAIFGASLEHEMKKVKEKHLKGYRLLP